MSLESDKENQHLMHLAEKAHKFYNSSKQKYPLLNSSLSSVEPLFTPITSRLQTYGTPVVKELDSQLDTWIQRGQHKLETQKLSLKEKKEFYKAAIQAWMQNHKEFGSFLEKVKEYYSYPWTDTLKDYSQWFYTRSLSYKDPKEMLNLAADLLSEGCDNLCAALFLSWDNLSSFDYKSFAKSVKSYLGQTWDSKVKEKTKIFYSLTKMRQELEKTKGLAKNWLVQVQETADRTSVLIFATADELYDWSLATLDQRVVAYFLEIPPEPSLKGSARIWDMQRRLGSQLNNYFTQVQGQVEGSKSFKYLDEKLYLKEKLLMASGFYSSVRNFSSDQILDQTWPQDLREKMDILLVDMGADGVLNFFRAKVWQRLDYDEDGIVTVRDLWTQVKKAKDPQNLKNLTNQLWELMTQLLKVNGEN